MRIATIKAPFLNNPTVIEEKIVDLAANAWYNSKKTIVRNTKVRALTILPVLFNSTKNEIIATIVIISG